MAKKRNDGRETRERLLVAAGVIFADKGFRDATTADICRQAKANIAAVNYHFGSKERLYIESWRHAFKQSLVAHPPDGRVLPTASAEERLRGQIKALLHRTMDSTNLDFTIGYREMTTPTGLLAEVMRRSIDPLRLALQGVVRELLGVQATDLRVRLCETSIHAQCFSPLTLARHQHRCTNGKAAGPPPLAVDADVLAEHVFRFSLAGICAVRQAGRRTEKTNETTAQGHKKGTTRRCRSSYRTASSAPS